MKHIDLSRNRLLKAKRAFTTRRVPFASMKTIVSGDIKPVSGNLVLATVHELGKHRRIERIDGRRAWMLPGDEILVCFGNRYAPDQFEAIVGNDLGMCDLVASGGVASREISRHDRMLPPTRIIPLGIIGDEQGTPLNIADFSIKFPEVSKLNKVILVVGTAMNSGKTFTAASIIRGLKQNGHRVAGIKATGTGSGGDLWKMKDMGADVVMDFTDGGFASTYKIPNADIEKSVIGLIYQARKRRCEYTVVEIADGLQHDETATLLRSKNLQSITSDVVFAAYDSLGACAGYRELRELGYSVMAISGIITRSPLSMREVAIVDCPLYSPFDIQAGALIPAITGKPSCDILASPIPMVNPSTFEDSDNVINLDSAPLSPGYWQREAGSMRLFDYAENIEESS